ncbi:MAG: helix-turn-helix domain-containing protein, partial [Candidatus Poribacteria bacterium]
KVDVRIIAATNKSLEQLVKERKFREDLYYRLKIVTIDIPPLRERKEDIPELVYYFLERRMANKNLITEQTMEKLLKYHWPGNVRELDNTIQRALILSNGRVITDSHIIFDSKIDAIPQNIDELEAKLEQHLELLFNYILNQENQNIHSDIFGKIERFLIKRALKETNHNQVQTAKLLGISRNTLRHRMQKYGIN